MSSTVTTTLVLTQAQMDIDRRWIAVEFMKVEYFAEGASHREAVSKTRSEQELANLSTGSRRLFREKSNLTPNI